MELNVDSFQSRFQKLFLEGKKVVYIKNQFDHSTFRYRCYNVVQAMSKQQKYVLTYFLSSEIPKINKYLERVDILILQRAMWDLNIENIIFSAKNLGIKVVYDIDDLIINPKYVPLYLNNLGMVNEWGNFWDMHFSTAAKYYTVAVECESFIATNKFLGDFLKEDFQKEVHIIPNFLNQEQEYHSEKIRREKEKYIKPFVLGYFSGSPSHKEDFNLIVQDIKSFLTKYDDTFLKIVGYIELPKELEDCEDRIIQVPFVSYEELQYEIGEVDVNLVPLQQNLFNNCKSELKYFEAGVTNVVSCCSPTYVYKQIVKDGENGYLCKEGEWFEKLSFIYENHDKVAEIVKKACKTSLDLYGVRKQSAIITKVYDSILKH